MSNLEKRRTALLAQIQNNPFLVDLKRPTETTDGTGNKRYSAPFVSVVTPPTRYGRVAFKSTSVPERQDGTPVNTHPSWFLLTDWLTVPREGDQLTDGESRSWEIHEVSALSKFGGIFGYESWIRPIDG